MPKLFDPMADDEPKFELIPEGEYRALVEHAELKSNKAGTGTYVQVNLSLVDAPYRGRKLRAFLTYEHPTPAAQAIGNAKIRRLLRSSGVTKPIDVQNDISAVTKNKVVPIKVQVKDGDRGEQNEVEDFVASQAASAAPQQRVPAHQDVDAPF